MKRLYVMLAVAVAVTAVTAQPQTGIAGAVYDGQTMEPIIGARVMTMHGGMTYTDSTGAYLLDLRRAGDYVVNAVATGYEMATYPDTVHVEEGQVVEGIDFALEPAAACSMGYISGEVTDELTGEIIRGALVLAENEGYSRQVTQCCRGYRIPVLPGTYWVSAVAPGYEPGAYGDSVDVAAGQTVEHIDFALGGGNPGDFGSIAGAVTDASTGDPLLGANVMAVGPMRAHDNTDEEGAYLIERLLPGSYVVTAHMRGFRPAAPETVEVVAGGAIEDLDFALEPCSASVEFGYVTGTVTDAATGDPIALAMVMGRGPVGQRGTRADSQGVYLLALRPGPYLVRACAEEYLPSVYPETVWVTVDDTVAGIDFELEHVLQLRAAIGGWVFDGYTQDELAGALVTAIGPDYSYETTTGEWGEYLFDDVEPGDYRVTVTRDGYEPVIYRQIVTVDPDQSEGYSTPAIYPLTGIAETPTARQTVERLEVLPSLFNLSSTVRYTVPVAGRVSLKVTDLAGRTVATLVNANLAAGRYEATWNGTGANGRRLAGGVYFYRLEAPGLRAFEKVVLTAR